VADALVRRLALLMEVRVTAQDSIENRIGMARQLAGNMVRFGWYSGINRLADLANERGGNVSPPVERKHPVPGRDALMRDLRALFQADAALVRDGLAVVDGGEPAAGVFDHLARLRAMFADLGEAAERRQSGDTETVKDHSDLSGVPDYFAQDFHFQKGGYLAEDSARIYDVQVETLFYGAASAMRRAAMRPIAEYIAGRDQRRVSLVDVACGTGRLLREVRLQYPAMPLTGLDLSPAYLKEASAHLKGLRRVDMVAGNAESIPLPDASQDIVTTVFLFHELPPLVRRQVAREMARVLKPGGRLIFIDSLQMGDRPGWDGLLEAFPQRFHEPYFRHYAIDDLDGLFAEADLAAEAQSVAFLSKVMVRRKV
jgi:ubiquinone/menaquinone biosynthesis C-methylase UbiE